MMIVASQREVESLQPYRPQDEDVVAALNHLHIEPVSANWFDCTPEWQLKPRRMSESYWTRVTSGYGTLYLGDNEEEYEIGPGNLIMFPQYCLHSIVPDRGCAMSMINVRFLARLYGILDLVSHYNLGGVNEDNVDGLFDLCSREAVREYHLQPTGWRRGFRSRIELVLLELLRNRSNPSSGTGNLAQLSRLEPVFKLIESRLGDPNLTVTDMAEELKLSEVYLRKLFQANLGVSPVQYLRRRRIDHACDLLDNTVLPAKNIAVECGFRDVQFFHRVFREMTGTTPRKYRNSPGF